VCSSDLDLSEGPGFTTPILGCMTYLITKIAITSAMRTTINGHKKYRYDEGKPSRKIGPKAIPATTNPIITSKKPC